MSAAIWMLALLGSNTWYVDASSPGGGDGSPQSPYSTIQAAFDAPTTVALDTVLVLPGLYVEDLKTKKRLSLHSTNGAEVTVIEAVDGPAVWVQSINNFSGGSLDIEGFTIRGATTSEGILVSAPNCDATVTRCIVTGNSIGIRGRWDVYVHESTIAGNSIGYQSDNYGIDWAYAYFEDSILHANDASVGVVYGALAQWPNFMDANTTVIEPVGDFLTGGTVLNEDPLFWEDPADWQLDERDFHLRPGSPAVGAGGVSVDLGALPYDGAYAPAPATYCTPKLTSQGCLASIGFTGTVPSASSPSPFLVTAEGVPNNKTGVFFFGLGEFVTPFQNGWLCVQPPVQRTTLQFSGAAGGPCSGSYAYDLNAAVQGGVSPVLVPGTSLNGQYWFRDPGDPFSSAFSDAVVLGIAE